jgi:hypothetical protein
MAHHYRYYQRLKRKTKARPLMLGSAVHTLIESQLEYGSYDITPIQAEYDKLFSEEKAELGDIPGDASRIVSGYFNYYAHEQYAYPKVWFGKNTELHVQVDLGSRIAFQGYIDCFPQNELGYWICDHKTAKSLPDEASRFSDLQTVMYTWAAPQAGLPKPAGVIWDYIRTKAPAVPEVLKNGEVSMRKNIDTTPEVYLETVKRHLGSIPDQYREFAKTLEHKRSDFFQRVKLPSPSPRLIEFAIRDLKESGREIRETGETSTVRTMTKDCSWCSYYPLCAAEVRGLDSTTIRKTLYEVSVGHTKEVEGKSADSGE